MRVFVNRFASYTDVKQFTSSGYKLKRLGNPSFLICDELLTFARTYFEKNES
jgi:hypothetical protein